MVDPRRAGGGRAAQGDHDLAVGGIVLERDRGVDHRTQGVDLDDADRLWHGRAQVDGDHCAVQVLARVGASADGDREAEVQGGVPPVAGGVDLGEGGARRIARQHAGSEGPGAHGCGIGQGENPSVWRSAGRRFGAVEGVENLCPGAG